MATANFEVLEIFYKEPWPGGVPDLVPIWQQENAVDFGVQPVVVLRNKRLRPCG